MTSRRAHLTVHSGRIDRCIVALVTGSATGIGRAVAVRFAAQGLAVAVNSSRSAAEAEETLAAVKAHGVPALLGQGATWTTRGTIRPAIS
jgi:NAD(P)-dependent dehydrogenase (short-subunit alcohol dehydrogenase family)